MRNNKNGITVTSITVYIILFFMFTTVTTIISSGFNEDLFNDRGMAINITGINKLEYNLLKSAEDSYEAEIKVQNQNTIITFSNFDEYIIDLEKHVIYKNGGKLVNFVSECLVKAENSIIEFDITVNKYTSELNRSIKVNIPLSES